MDKPRLTFPTLVLLGLCALFSSGVLAGSKGKIELVYGEWSTEIASTNLIKVVLEDLGYDVTIRSVAVGAMWQAIAEGDVDGMVAAWLPTTQQIYYDKVRDRIDDLGPNLIGTRVGLVVPAYVEIDSIAELAENAARFDNKIIGIEPGTGMMRRTEQVMATYGLEDMKLVESSGPIMTAVLGDAIKDGDWVVVTGWTPHWMFSTHELKYLADPENIYGGVERIHTVVRKGLAEDMPEAYAVLDNFHWTPEQMGELMAWNEEKRADPYENARRWVETYPEVVQSWLP
ncbi:glycine/betaine ABC transporter substrate-binding protein [Marichromatium purpuratum 984]|uniref:Glycine/betaine ABC transporter substrate-binding protein n=1 Tax=Marichromatium purpuratum 984 TaxID=765910 RepID=W0E2X6_MARPU|nr:glycine betaine ABC transporter substrate-binding protein [Marichromatium purpuratum]AHF05180.1 glycine/betaine ABC transporter substrate-binding protein [Marichromatium purpuratum 984]